MAEIGSEKNTRLGGKVAFVDQLLSENPYMPVYVACEQAGISKPSYYRLKTKQAGVPQNSRPQPPPNPNEETP